MKTLETSETEWRIVRRPRSRGVDRRASFAGFLASLASGVEQQAKPHELRAAFEEGVRRLVPVQTSLRGEPRIPAVPRPSSPDRLSFEIRTSDPAHPACLEFVVDAGHRLDEWDLQALAMASHLGALVVEIERRRAATPARALVAVQSPDGAAPIIGSSEVMRALRDRMERVAATDFTVLIEGESGTGKELVARQIHEVSLRRNGPFVAVNCAAVVETLLEAELFGIEDRTATGVRGRRGKFEHADGGTVFLDEVSDLSLSAQAKLLRVIQDLTVERVGGHGSRRVDLRIVAATNKSLATLVERRLFRPDLFYRLSGVDLHVPSLRQRREDILELANYFLERHRHTRQLSLSAIAADALTTYDWPGNVRELERLMERAVALAETSSIELDDLPARLRSGYSEILLPSLEQSDTLRAWGSRYVRLILERCRRNKRRACRTLGISYHTLQAYLAYPSRMDEAAAGESPPWDAPDEVQDAGVDPTGNSPAAACRVAEC
jgi:DNA-binding NtrC family response regulator